MKKIITLFKRDYEGNRQVYDEVVPGAEWVLRGEGVATVKYDGTCCLVRGGKLYKRYDRKLTKSANKRRRNKPSFTPSLEHFKPAPEGWEAAEPSPNKHTGHWPGWLPVGDGPEDKWHREALRIFTGKDGTYELVGPKVQGNPYGLAEHHLWRHGLPIDSQLNLSLTFEGIRDFLEMEPIEGIVWHHPDGRMVKIKRRDFGLDWPVRRQRTR